MLHSLLINSLSRQQIQRTTQDWLFFIVKSVCCSLLITIGAHASFIFPISPVPFTLQTEALIVIAFIWGRKIAAGAVIAYFIQGIYGLPVFAMGISGIWPFFSTSGGYLLGFLPAVYIMGACADLGWGKNPLLTGIAVLLGKFMLYSCGLFYLAQIIPGEQLLSLGLFPFIPDALTQVGLATFIVPTIMYVGQKISNQK